MCESIVEGIKRNNPEKLFYADFHETPGGYFYRLSADPKNSEAYRGNIFQITRHAKWLNAKKGYLMPYHENHSILKKAWHICRIIMVFGWTRKKLIKWEAVRMATSF